MRGLLKKMPLHRICTFTIQNFGCIIKITEVGRRKNSSVCFFFAEKRWAALEERGVYKNPARARQLLLFDGMQYRTNGLMRYSRLAKQRRSIGICS